MEIRPLRETDIAAVVALDRALFADPPEIAPELAVARGEARQRHLLATDPDGGWVAEDDAGELAGVSVGILRDDVWGLSLLDVRADLQARGIGRRLLDAALAYGDGARGRIVLSSTDPRAMRRYARAGLRLVPLVSAGGIVDRSRLRPADGVRVGTSADFEATAAASRFVRGATHHHDLPTLVAAGRELLVHERGFAVHDAGTPKLLAALDDDAASALLWACLAAAGPGATIGVNSMSSGQDWAVQVALEAGLALSPDGPLFVSGELGPLRPYLPSGPYL
jgi:GNAT superfamily N-acetyltransferase